MTLNGTPTVATKFRPVKDAVGNITLQPVEGTRAAAFRKEIQAWIELAKSALDPIREWFNIGPVEATVLLSFSGGNRSEPAPTVAMFARDIEHNHWHQTHQGLAFTRAGRLGDGHHRCKAIIESGKVVRVAIDFGVDDEAIRFVDMGRSRNIPDQLVFKRGIRNSRKLVATVRMCMALVDGKMHVPAWSLSEVESGLATHERGIKALSKFARTRFPASFWGAMLYAYPIAPESVEALAHKVVHGEGISGAALTLREYLIHAGGRNADPFTIAQRTLFAAHAFIERRPLTKFPPKDSSVFGWFAARRG